MGNATNGYWNSDFSEVIRQYRTDRLLTIRKRLREMTSDITQEQRAWYTQFSRISRMFERLQTIGGTVRVSNPRKFQTACAFARIPITSSGIAIDIFCIGAIPESLFESIACHIIGVLESADEGLNISVASHARLTTEQIEKNKKDRLGK